MKVDFGTQIIEIMDDRVIFLQVIIIIQQMAWNIPDK